MLTKALCSLILQRQVTALRAFELQKYHRAVYMKFVVTSAKHGKGSLLCVMLAAAEWALLVNCPEAPCL